MNCKINKDLLSNCDYSVAGIHSIYILDIDYFDGYIFDNDTLYDSIYVDDIYIKGDWYKLASVDEANFTEKNNNSSYQQQLTTFISLYEADIQRELLKSTNSKFLVAFRTFTRKWFVFGSDGGATLSYQNQSGAKNDSIGYSITITCNSSFPLFELNPDYFNKSHTVNYIYQPLFDPYTCDLNGGYNNGYQVANVSVRITKEGEAVDKDGKLCSITGNKQGAMKLEGTTSPLQYDIVGTYNSNDIIKGGVAVKQINYIACRPQFQGTIKLDKYLIISNASDYIHQVKVTSENEWMITNYRPYYVTSNYTKGIAGEYDTINSMGQYGNTKHIYKNQYTLEEVELTVCHCAVIIPNDNFDMLGEGETKKLSLIIRGGDEDYNLSNVPSWLTITKEAEQMLNIVAQPNDTKVERVAYIQVTHNTDSRVSTMITIRQERNIVITIPDFNYLTFRYFWTTEDGRDLDTSTVLVNTGLVDNGVTIDDKAVGWQMNGNSVPEVQKYLKFGGDNQGSGNECVFIDWLSLCSEENLEKLPDVIYCDMYANWYGEKLNGYMSFEINAYKGGTMIKDPTNTYNYINEGGELKFQSTQSKYVYASCTSNKNNYKTDYTYTARISYNKETQNATLEIIQSTSGNDCK